MDSSYMLGGGGGRHLGGPVQPVLYSSQAVGGPRASNLGGPRAPSRGGDSWTDTHPSLGGAGGLRASQQGRPSTQQGAGSVYGLIPPLPP
eukprot:499351-Pelagomonas_calceolata.AAC.4